MRPDERRKAWKTGGVFVGIRRELFQTDKLAAVEGQYWTGSWGLLGANRWGWAKKKWAIGAPTRGAQTAPHIP